MAILERSLEERFGPKPKQAEPEIPQPIEQKEWVGGQELLAEAQEIQARMLSIQDQLVQGIISQEDYKIKYKRNQEALEAVLMALELDRYVLLSII